MACNYCNGRDYKTAQIDIRKQNLNAAKNYDNVIVTDDGLIKVCDVDFVDKVNEAVDEVLKKLEAAKGVDQSIINDQKAIYQEIQSVDQHITETLVRRTCAHMMFSGDLADKKISVLSGGEKSRVMLGKILLKPVREKIDHMDRFIKDSAHELNTPVTVLMTSTSMLKKGKNPVIKSFTYIDIKGGEHAQLMLIKCPAFKKNPLIKHWYRLTTELHRRFLLLKVTLINNKVAYLLEIQLREKESGYSGLIFHCNSNDLSGKIYNLIEKIAENKGRFHEQVKGEAMKPLALPQSVRFSYIYRHSRSQDLVFSKMKTVIKSAENKGVFQ